MCSQGSFERGSTYASARCSVLSGQIRKSAPIVASLAAGASISLPTPPVIAVEAHHVVGERMRVHRNFGMGMGAEQPRALCADGAIAKSCAFGRAGNDADVEGHALGQIRVNAWVSTSTLAALFGRDFRGRGLGD